MFTFFFEIKKERLKSFERFLLIRPKHLLRKICFTFNSKKAFYILKLFTWKLFLHETFNYVIPRLVQVKIGEYFIFVPIQVLKISTYGTKYSRMDQVKFFKGCLPQILLGPFLNILSHIKLLFTRLRFSLLVNRKPPIGISQETANITIFSATLIYKKTITFKKFYFCGDAPLNCFL